ncbi:MAG: hypothetical protein ABR955_16590, partial [Verrucomicrobiota bacterium]
MERMTGFSAIAISNSTCGAVRCSPLRAAVCSLLSRCSAAVISAVFRCFQSIKIKRFHKLTRNRFRENSGGSQIGEANPGAERGREHQTEC